jgi:hypothetical protein
MQETWLAPNSSSAASSLLENQILTNFGSLSTTTNGVFSNTLGTQQTGKLENCSNDTSGLALLRHSCVRTYAQAANARENFPGHLPRPQPR